MGRLLVLLVGMLCASVADAQLEKRDVHIAVGGKNAFYYLPLTIAEQLGYFKDEGLDVKISDFAGGSAALRAVVGGSAEVVSGAYEHTISLQGKKQHFQAFVLQGRLPQIALGVTTSKAATFRSSKSAANFGRFLLWPAYKLLGVEIIPSPRSGLSLDPAYNPAVA